ncbi:MAG: hypothetical protein JWL83_2901 [Actinomycetia bacterium]|nr:hypothetical protein [Actinomycetes bacterium]
MTGGTQRRAARAATHTAARNAVACIAVACIAGAMFGAGCGSLTSTAAPTIAPTDATVTRTTTITPTSTPPMHFTASSTPPLRRAPEVKLRRPITSAAPLRVAYIGDSVGFSLVPSLTNTAHELVTRYHLPLSFAGAGGFMGPGFGLTADVPGHNDIGPTPPAAAFAHWQDSITKMIAVDNPDLVVVMIGVWDTIERDPLGLALRPGMPGWARWYGGLADTFVKTLTQRGAAVIWVVMPCVGRPDINVRLGSVNAVLRHTRRIAPRQIGFVPLAKVACHGTTPIYQIPGPLGPLTIREADGIHFRPIEAPPLLEPFLVRQFASLLQSALPAAPRSAVPTAR